MPNPQGTTDPAAWVRDLLIERNELHAEVASLRAQLDDPWVQRYLRDKAALRPNPEGETDVS